MRVRDAYTAIGARSRERIENMEGSISLMDVVKEDGVKDLALKMRGPFAKALIAERNGNNGEASRQLDLAVEAEAIVAAQK